MKHAYKTVTVFLLAIMLTGCQASRPVSQAAAAPPGAEMGIISGPSGASSSLHRTGVTPMTWQELLACTQEMEQVDGEESRLRTEYDSLRQRQQTVADEQRQIDMDRPLVDSTAVESVIQFNHRVKVLNETASRLNLDAVKFNEDGTSFQAKINHIHIACSDRAYLASDSNRLSAGQKKILRRNTDYDRPPAIVEFSAPFATQGPNSSTHVGGR